MSISFKIDDIAYQAALQYIRDGVNMTDSIVKAAKECGLNSEMIDRVCERANHLVNEVALAKQANRYTDFELADPQRVKAAINITEGITTVSRKAETTPRVVDMYSRTKKQASIEKQASTVENKQNIQKKIDKSSIGLTNIVLTTKTASEMVKLANEVGYEPAMAIFHKLANELPQEIKDYIEITVNDEISYLKEERIKIAAENYFVSTDKTNLEYSINKLKENIRKIDMLEDLVQ